MAPELLRIPNRPQRGTQKGDVYSFAIILQEFHTREGPYSSNFMEPKGWFAFRFDFCCNQCVLPVCFCQRDLNYILVRANHINMSCSLANLFGKIYDHFT